MRALSTELQRQKTWRLTIIQSSYPAGSQTMSTPAFGETQVSVWPPRRRVPAPPVNHIPEADPLAKPAQVLAAGLEPAAFSVW